MSVMGHVELWDVRGSHVAVSVPFLCHRDHLAFAMDVGHVFSDDI